MNRLTLASAGLALTTLVHGVQAEEPHHIPSATSHPALTIRAYAARRGDMPSAFTLDLAASLLADTGILTHWIACGLTGADRMCLQTLGPGELAFRFLRNDRKARGQRTLSMGDSLIDTSRGTGVLATLYRDRIDEVAMATGGDAAVILARAIAHETAHLVLGTSDHGSSGLMRPLWSREMLRAEPKSAWVFTPDEGRRVREALAARLPSSPSR